MRNSIPRTIILASILLTLTILGQRLQAQTFTVLHTFTSGGDGGFPYAGLTIDSGGNLYGTTSSGGSHGDGVVFRLSHAGSGWALTPLYSFQSGTDGEEPYAPVVIGPNGSLYGTTYAGGGTGCYGNGCGTVFNVRPPTHASTTVLGNWDETVLYSFQGGNDGANPGYGYLLFDQAGNIYGTTTAGGLYNQGTVFELTLSNGSWGETVLYSFTGGNDAAPMSGVTMDDAGNLYGVASGNGGFGSIYQLTPSSSGWIKTTLYNFQDQDDGRTPVGGLIMDQAGNLYGTTSEDGELGGGTVWELSPNGGQWSFGTITQLPGNDGVWGPWDRLTADPAGNLYATSVEGDGCCGQVWQITSEGGGPQFLHYFISSSGGQLPYGSVTLDSSGNLYGTTSHGYPSLAGEVWEITP